MKSQTRSFTASPSLDIVYRDPAGLKPHPNNARTHSKAQLLQLRRSIKQFGFTNPILLDAESQIIAGHGRVLAAREMGLGSVPTVCITWMTDAQKRAYIIADNRLAELAGWDRPLLGLELGEIAALDPDLDLTVTGFSLDDVTILTDLAIGTDDGDDDPEDTLEPNVGQPAMTRQGDLWTLGDHRLLCGDARDRDAYRQLLGRERADLVITDPPFNVPVAGHVSGLGKTRHREFPMASGEMTREQFRDFLEAVLTNLAWASRSGALSYIFMDWRSIADLISVGEICYEQFVNLVVWSKSNGGMGSLYRSQHELIAIFKRGHRSHLNNVALGANGRYRTNVWAYPGANSFGAARDAALAMHPTVKPVAMITDAILDVTRTHDIILDPFAGSGTTLFAAHGCDRRARLMELDPLYCDVILRRALEAGLEVRLGGEAFETVRRERMGIVA